MKNFCVFFCLILLFNISFAQNKRIDVSNPDWKTILLQTKPSEQIEVNGLFDSETGQRSATRLMLTSKRISDASSVVLVHSAEGVTERKLPRRHYFEGYVADDLHSRVLLIIGQDRSVRGLVRQNGGISALVAQPAGLSRVRVETDSVAEPFSCGSDALTPPSESVMFTQPPEELPVRGVPPEGYLARIALETDYQYYQKFSNVDQAVAYAMDLTAFSSTIYDDEVSTRMAISTVSIWTDPADPWSQGSSICQLYEFGQFWNNNRSNIDRSVAHLLSGRSSNSGVAWVGTMCGGSFNVNAEQNCPGFGNSNYGGNYGFSGGIDGNFDLSSPRSVWDIVVFAHELGHNFNSPHTHCYNGIGGNSSPVDECFNGEANRGCYAGPQSLPGASGQGSGTIMSYCHLRGGGLSNIGLTLGLDHPFGVEPERVPDRMMAHVISRENANPGCFTTALGPALYLETDDSDLVEGETLELTIGVDQIQTSDVVIDLSQTAGLSGTFSNLNGHVIPANQQAITIQLPTLDDGVFNDTLSGDIAVSNVFSLLPVLDDAILSITVQDNDARAVVTSLSLDVSEIVEGETATATVTLDQTTLAPVEVTLQLSTALANLLQTLPAAQTISVGQLSTSFSLQFIDDDDYQQSQTGGIIFIERLSSDAPTTIGSPSELQLTVLDNDLPDSILTVDSFEGN